MGQCLCATVPRPAANDAASADADVADAMVAVGNRRALLIGINYVGTKHSLRGCINDVRTQKQSLLQHYGFEESDIRILADDQQPGDHSPNKANIEAGLRWLYTGAAAGDLLYFAYSGHGSQVPSWGGGSSQCICPVDCLDKPWPDSVIVDTEIHHLLFDPLPLGCKAIAIFDCCHSGTVANLSVTRDMFPEAVSVRYMEPPTGPHAPAAGPQAPGGIHQMIKSGKVSKDHLLWVLSGCQDSQTSADAYRDGMYQGAFTWGLVRALAADGWHLRYSRLLDGIKAALREGGYPQLPELSTTHVGYLDHWFMDIPQ